MVVMKRISAVSITKFRLEPSHCHVTKEGLLWLWRTAMFPPFKNSRPPRVDLIQSKAWLEVSTTLRS